MPNRPNASLTERAAVIPVSAAFHAVEPRAQPTHFVFILLPRFTFLAFASALDPLRIANQLAQRPLYRWTILSEDGAPVESSSGISVNVDGRLGSLPQGSQVFVCSGIVTRNPARADTVAAIRRHAQHGGRVGGICTGAVTLARAGLLKGKRVTLHWENQPAFEEEFPDILTTGSLYEIDGKIVTCSGGSAAVDMMIGFISEDYGARFGAKVGEMCLRANSRVPDARQRSSVSNQIGWRNPRLSAAIRLMSENIEDALTLDEIAAAVGSSRRQLERLFSNHLGTTPSKHYRDLRLDHARGLLRETDLSVTETAVASGFSSIGVFYKSFRRRFGKSPRAYQDQ